MYQLVTTYSGREEFKLFSNLPSLLYPEGHIRLLQKDDLNLKYLHTCIVLLKNGNAVARLSVYLNPLLKYAGNSCACIGDYECEDDNTTSSKILNAAKEIAKKARAEYLIGPMNGSSWNNYRFSTSWDEPLFFSEPYHHLYYNQQFLDYGFSIIGKYFSAVDASPELKPVKHSQVEKSLIEQCVAFRNINMADFEKEVQNLHEFSNDAFKGNFLFTPEEWEPVKSKYLPLEKILQPELVIIAEDKNGAVAGFSLALPDIYNPGTAIIKTIARKPGRDFRGLGAILTFKLHNAIVEAGYKRIIHAFMYEQNSSLAISKALAGTTFRKYVLYGTGI